MSEPTDSVFIRHLTPRNFLSFGPDNPGIALKPLNLFIGPNGSGKSNLIKAVSLMRAAPKAFRDVTRKGGGVSEWIWKGRPKDAASVEWVVSNPNGIMPLRHGVSFRSVSQSFSLEDERVENEKPLPDESDAFFYYRYQHGQATMNTVAAGQRSLARDTIETDRSILGQRRDPEAYPELAWLSQNYERIRIYRDWAFGHGTVYREAQQADMRRHFLEDDFSNLGLFLNRIKSQFPVAKRAILKALQELYDGISDFEINTNESTVQVVLHEGDFAIPAPRLSDGTLHYLCLLAILFDPEPPPVICIEEPELGLHPDILPTLADLLRAASERTQLIVTTHSDILVDEMTETPEAVVVFSKEQGQTTMKRLNADDLGEWLTKYRLGQLWTRGHTYQPRATRWVGVANGPSPERA